jgi:hypothetical protein
MRTVSAIGVVSAFGALFLACEAEEESFVDPTAEKPDAVQIVRSRDTLLTGARDSSHWSIQLTRGGQPLQKSYAIVLSTDLGYFVDNGAQVQRVTVVSDDGGVASAVFYSGQDPGFATTLAWGDGFGIDTVRSVLIVGMASVLRFEFSDANSGNWRNTDTLVSGERLAMPDSTLIRVTVMDNNLLPVADVRVDLTMLIDGGVIVDPAYGYFAATTGQVMGTSGYAYTDNTGQGLWNFYSDDLPNSGQSTLEVEARVDSALFGRISTTRRLLIVAP